MKKLLIILAICCSCTVYGQQVNMLTAYFSNDKAVTLEYGFNLDDKVTQQHYGFDVGAGYNLNRDFIKVTGGLHGITHTGSRMDFIYKIGLSVYDFKGYDSFIGFGIRSYRAHIITKVNLIQSIGAVYNDLNVRKKEIEFFEVGFGISF